MTQFAFGVRTTRSTKTQWVQTGFTAEQAEAEAERLNQLGTIPGVTYESARVK